MLKTYLDEKLMEKAEDPALLQKLLSKTQADILYLRKVFAESPDEENETRLGRMLQRHGTYLRLSGEFQAARDAKHEAIAIWKKYDRRRAHFLARFQLALIEIPAGAPEKTVRAIEELLTEIDEKTLLYQDFLFEGLGRAYFRLQHFHQAGDALQKALELRKIRGNQRHVQETLEALEQVAARMA